MLPQISSYELKISKTGHKIPVVNNVHLHSIYDPFKEADEFIKKNNKFFQSKNNILFLGLGFGYHVNQAIKVLHEYHNGNYSIVIIEPNGQVAKDSASISNFKNKNIKIYTKKTIESLYLDRNLISFLLDRPSIISHPPSFNLYKEYFKEFLTYKSPQSISSMKNISFDKELKKILNEINPNKDINSYIQDELMQKRTMKNDNEFLFLAFHHLIKQEGL